MQVAFYSAGEITHVIDSIPPGSVVPLAMFTMQESHSKEEMGKIFTNAYGQATSISQVFLLPSQGIFL